MSRGGCDLLSWLVKVLTSSNIVRRLDLGHGLFRLSSGDHRQRGFNPLRGSSHVWCHSGRCRLEASCGRHNDLTCGFSAGDSFFALGLLGAVVCRGCLSGSSIAPTLNLCSLYHGQNRGCGTLWSPHVIPGTNRALRALSRQLRMEPWKTRSTVNSSANTEAPKDG